MADKYHKELICREGSVTIQTFPHFTSSGERCEVQPIHLDLEVDALAMTPAQARELASMLIAGADIADGLPARPARITDVPLLYEHRADTSKGEGE